MITKKQKKELRNLLDAYENSINTDSDGSRELLDIKELAEDLL